MTKKIGNYRTLFDIIELISNIYFMAIQSVQRALDILLLFSPTQPQLGITEIARIMELPKPTIHGLVQTLTERNFLVQDIATKKYSLGLKIHEMGVFLSSTIKINQVGRELVQRLAKKYSNWARLAIWNNDSMLITMNLFPDTDFVHFQQLGPRIPAYCSALGKAVLSTFSPEALDDYLNKVTLSAYTTNTITDKNRFKEHIQDIRRQGYAEESEECLMGMSCIGVPIFDFERNAIGAISIAVNYKSISQEELDSIVSEIKQAAMEISRRMGFISEIKPL